jgi:hypothetical protein
MNNDGVSCDDGLFCTDPDTCTSGECGGPPRDCADVDPTTLDTCNKLLGACEHEAMPTACPMGDGTFASKVDYAAGNLPYSVTSGDFNSDGILDLVVANSSSNNVSILLGNGSYGRGDGTFAAKVDYAAGSNPYFVTTGDFNADGILDLVVANGGSNNVSILLGNGSSGRADGTFAAKVDYAAGNSPYSVATGDFNQDGILDLAVTNHSSNTVSILLGNGSSGHGNGTFAVGAPYQTGVSPTSVKTSDFNDDGILDLAVTNYSSATVSIFLGNGSGGRGNGTFAAMVPYPTESGPISVTTGDFNADSILDLAVASGSGYVSLLLGNGSGGRGNGTFASRVSYPVGSVPEGVGTGDFNADGILDLVVTNRGSTSVSVLLGNGSGGRGDGTFAGKVDYAAGSGAVSVTTGDFNSDGILDLAVANSGSSSVSVLLGNGSGGLADGKFAAKVDYTVGANPRSVTTGDFNADRILDLAVANTGSNPGLISVLLGNGSRGRGNGTFAPKEDYPVWIWPAYVATGDFNKDGILDLVVANWDETGWGDPYYFVSVLLGNGSSGRGDGTFAPKANYPTGLHPSSVATGDFNSDGIVDLAVANNHKDVTHDSNDDVSVLLGNGAGGRGNGTFAPKVDYITTKIYPISIAAGDFNADGILDLVVTNNVSSPDNVGVFLGNGSVGRGNGTFAAMVRYSAGESPSSVATGDFNSDRILDLAVANNGTGGVNSSNNVSVLLGNGSGGRGNGTFAPKVDYATAPNLSCPMSVTTGDFNRDGILDLAVSNKGLDETPSTVVSVLLGNGSGGRGNGTFAPKVDYEVGTAPFGVATGDFNSDGILDLVVANSGTNSVSVLLGNGICKP